METQETLILASFDLCDEARPEVLNPGTDCTALGRGKQPDVLGFSNWQAPQSQADVEGPRTQSIPENNLVMF